MASRRVQVVAGANYSRPIWNLSANNLSVARYQTGSQTVTQIDRALLNVDNPNLTSYTYLWLSPGGAQEWTFSEIYQDGQRVSSPTRIERVGQYQRNNKILLSQPFLFPDINNVHFYRDVAITANGVAKITPATNNLPDSFVINLPFGTLNDAQFEITTLSITGSGRQTWNRKIDVTYTVAPLTVTLNKYSSVGDGTSVWTSSNVSQRNININDYCNIRYSTSENDWIKIQIPNSLWCGFLKPSENNYADLADGTYSMSDLESAGFLQKLTRIECWRQSGTLPTQYNVGLYNDTIVMNPLYYYI